MVPTCLISVSCADARALGWTKNNKKHKNLGLFHSQKYENSERPLFEHGLDFDALLSQNTTLSLKTATMIFMQT